MARAPRKAKELVQLLSDPDLRQTLYNLVAQHDSQVEDALNKAIGAHLAKAQITLDFLDHGEVTKAIQSFFKKSRLMGKYVKLY